MKQIIKNRFIKPFSFKTYNELSYFSKSYEKGKHLWLGGLNGQHFITYQFCDSLTNEVFFLLSFSSEKMESELALMQWHESKLIVVETDIQVHLINEELSIIASLDISSPIIGFHLTPTNNLLILEEASMRLIDFEGTIIMDELFDLAEDFTLEGNILTIKTAEGKRQIELR
jgi:hypothetical protein